MDFVKLMDPKKLRDDKSQDFFDDPNWFAETEINGRRIQCLINDGTVSFAGRYAREGRENIADFSMKFFKIRQDIEKLNLPNGTLLDGEIYLPGRSVSQTLQIVNALEVDTAVLLQEQYGFLHYTMFDVMWYDSASLLQTSLAFRKRKLASLIKPTFNISVLPFATSASEKSKLWKTILDSNAEEKSIVFKFCESDYECGRSKWWRKLKEVGTFVGVITGFKYDKHYPQDFVASIQVSQYRRGVLRHVADVGGFTKEQASDLRSKTESYLNKAVQFKADSKTESSYRNPRFDRLLLDKNPQSCEW